MGLAQLNFEGKNKVEVAIDRFIEYEPAQGYYLCDSGGKDSDAIHRLAVRSGTAFDAHYNVSPTDPPEVREHIRESRPDVSWDRTAKGFWKRFLIEGPPMRHMRWCCGYIKEAGGAGRVKVLGMRTAESPGRRNYQVFQPQNNMPGTYWFLPIFDWSNEEVWEYHRIENLSYCSLYDEGFERLGCVLCPFESPKTTQRNLQRFPKIVAVWRRAFERYYQVRIERGTPLSWASVDEYWEWWLSRV